MPDVSSTLLWVAIAVVLLVVEALVTLLIVHFSSTDRSDRGSDPTRARRRA